MTRHLTRAAIAGAASGLRSTAGLAALVTRRRPGLPGPLAHPLARPAAAVAVAVELVLDKLPSTPSRLEPVGIIGRVLFAGLAGATIARGARRPVVPAVTVACAAALAAAKAGHDLRAAAAEQLPPVAVALAEDGLALALAWAVA
jgi:uncharacterized membrane protein